MTMLTRVSRTNTEPQWDATSSKLRQTICCI